MKSSRFDYVKYDEQATSDQKQFKNILETLESVVIEKLKPGRAALLAMGHLEEAYMWIGKAIRDDQVERNKATELQEDRTNS